VKIEIGQAVDQQAAAAQRGAELNPTNVGLQPFTQVSEGDPEKTHKSDQNQQPANDAGLGQSLRIVVVGMVPLLVGREGAVAREYSAKEASEECMVFRMFSRRLVIPPESIQKKRSTVIITPRATGAETFLKPEPRALI
jgi:hypothetical protein